MIPVTRERGPRVDFDVTALYNLRHKHRLSQLELAWRAGLTPATISRLENGRQLPNLVTLERLAAALDVPLTRFTGPEIEPRSRRN
jgi:transcriptional regulator with XRE-family HTH domain